MEIRYVIIFLFFGTAFLDMLYVFKDVPKSRFFSKPLLMPLLLLFYLLSSKQPINFIIFALIFSFFGDLFLLWEKRKIFFHFRPSLFFICSYILHLDFSLYL
jgi:uncharacterized membrane protein YhhN